MKEFESDSLCNASGRYLGCPICGERSWLKLRKMVTFDFNKTDKMTYYSIHCEQCKLTFGEVDGEPVYESESDLLADWNRRKY